MNLIKRLIKRLNPRDSLSRGRGAPRSIDQTYCIFRRVYIIQYFRSVASPHLDY